MQSKESDSTEARPRPRALYMVQDLWGPVRGSLWGSEAGSIMLYLKRCRLEADGWAWAQRVWQAQVQQINLERE